MKIKNIMYVFLLINFTMAPAIHAMEQPNKQQTERPLRRIYPSNLPLLLCCGCLKNEESCLNSLPMELIVEIINHARKIKTDQDADLLKAARNNDKNEVRRLLNEHYIDINIKDENGYTVLNWAIKRSNPETVQILLDNGANLDIPATHGRIPLIYAVIYNNPEIVQMLLDKGANLDISDNNGYTALDWARKNNNQAIINLIIKAKEKLDCTFTNIGTSGS